MARISMLHLTAGKVSVLFDLSEDGTPAIVHWGAALGTLSHASAEALRNAMTPPQANSTVDGPIRCGVVPEHRAGWPGRPGLIGSREGRDWSAAFQVLDVKVSAGESTFEEDLLTIGGASNVSIVLADVQAELSLSLHIELSSQGVLRMSATLANTSVTPYHLSELNVSLPVPAQAREVLDFAGRWGKERIPQRTGLDVGMWLRESRRGRTGFDSAYLLTAGETGFGFERGEVWGVHVAHSGNHRHFAERVATGAQVIGGGELLLPGEIVLGAGDEYRTPWVYGVYGDGLDDQAARLHRMLRARPTHPLRPRPITINVWEAVYFDHDLARLTELADLAASVGIERFVLDDGWFRHRRDDTAGLGDWYVDEDVWPHGLSPLIDHVRGLGMEFGLWFEPEMVNLDSDLARAHPEWIMSTGGRMPLSSRNQQVLDLGNPAAYTHIRDRMVSILSSNDIAYVKWDHNRDLVDAGAADGRPGVHRQTQAVHSLMSELRSMFPALEIESCSSGGARIDLAVLEHTDRVWASDCIDPLERQQIHRWTSQLIPLELIGAHIASGRSHTTGRQHELPFRAGTAVFGHLGVEWDLSAASPEELDELRRWIELHREYRELLHTGDFVRIDSHDDAMFVDGVVASDGARALYRFAFTDTPDTSGVGRVRLRGLCDEIAYRVRHLTVGRDEAGAAPWMRAGVTLTGRELRLAGIQAPSSLPDRVWLVAVDAVE